MTSPFQPVMVHSRLDAILDSDKDLTTDSGKGAFAAFIRCAARDGLSNDDILHEAHKAGFHGCEFGALYGGIEYIAKFERANIEAERAAKQESEHKFTEAATDHLKLLELLQERLPSMIESIKAAQAILAVEPEA